MKRVLPLLALLCGLVLTALACPLAAAPGSVPSAPTVNRGSQARTERSSPQENQPVQPVAVGTVVLGSVGEDARGPEPHAIHAPLPVPSDLPVPIVFIGRKAAEVTGAPYFPAVPNTTSVSLLHNFLALDDNNATIPPDTAGAVGPNHLVVVHNTQIRVETRGGGVLSTAGTNSFFNAIRNGQRVFDPRIAYDTRAGRWIICAIADDTTSDWPSNTSSGLLLGISNSGDPLGAWTLYRFVGDPTNLTWLDYPQLGFDDSNIVISTNVYSISDDKFQYASIFVISKTARTYTRIDIPSSGGAMMPTVSLDPGSTSYLIQRWNGNSSGVGWMRLYSVSSAGVSPIAYVQGPQPWSSSGAKDADFAPQLGTSRLIDAGDDRVLSAVYRNGSIWATHTVFLPADSPKRASVQWWQISPSGLILQRGLIDDPAGATFSAYPSIAVNVRNDVLIGGSQFSSSTYASCFAAVRSSGDPPDTISSPLVYKSGLAPYYKLSTKKQNRWGDYSTSIVDPTNDTEFWTIQEYAATPSGGYDRWGTWWAHVAVSSTSGSVCTPNATTACVLNNRFQVKVRYRGAFDNNAADTDALVKSVTGFANPTYETAFFYFNSTNNIEMLIKMLDQGNTNGAGQPTIAVLFGSATPLRIELTITDTKTSAVKRYTSQYGSQVGQTDFSAFVK